MNAARGRGLWSKGEVPHPISRRKCDAARGRLLLGGAASSGGQLTDVIEEDGPLQGVEL